MKLIKKMLPFVLVVGMLLLTACNGGATNEPPETEAPQIETQPPETETPQTEEQPPAPPEDEDDYSETDNDQNDDEITTQPLPGGTDEPADSEISIDIITVDENIEYEEWPAVTVDGVGVQGSSHRLVGDELFPNYVSLVIVARAFGSQVGIEGNEIVLDGLDGRISFEIGSEIFTVGNATVRLQQPALVFDNVLYVPVEFFTEVFGAGEAFFSGGEVHISTEAGDMH
jgi:hypothetical protein